MEQKLTRRQLLARSLAGLGAGLVASASRPALAAAYPTNTVTIINPFAPGSVSDAAARLIAHSLETQLGQSFIVKNRVGAGGLLAGSDVARARPDGYTLLLTASSSFSGAALYKKMPFDPVKDFTHIARIGSFPSFIAVNPNLPVNSMAEFVAYAKAHPGKLSYGYGNNMGEIIGETLKRRTGIDVVAVAYNSNPAAVMALIGAQVQMMLPDLNTGLPQVRSGKIRPLAVFTKARCPELPTVPTLNETVMPGFELLPWCGLSGPADLPSPIVATLAKAVHASLDDPQVRKRFISSGVEVFWAGPRGFQEYVQAQLANWTALIHETGIPPQ